MEAERQELRVAIDVGSRTHRAAVGDGAGGVAEAFDISHDQAGFRQFFERVSHWAEACSLPVAVAMEGYNGWARPLDGLILAHGWRLLNVNNVKLARFKEIFPGAAKTDAIDAVKMLELFQLDELLPTAKQVLQVIEPPPEVNCKLKRLTRRRRQLVNERIVVLTRLQSDLPAAAPGLLDITADAANLWFLRFLTARDDLRQLARLQARTVRALPGVGAKYAALIQAWQGEAIFSADIDLVGEMIIEDARHILALREKIKGLEARIAELTNESVLAKRVQSIPGFGATSCAVLAGEIATLERFEKESSLALYLGMAALDNSSGKYTGARRTKQVNRHAQAAMMTAVARHKAHVPESQRYYEKKRRQGKTHNQAIRALGRHLVRVIWSMLQQERDYQIRSTETPDLEVAA